MGGCSSIGRAINCDFRGYGFDSYHPPKNKIAFNLFSCLAELVDAVDLKSISLFEYWFKSGREYRCSFMNKVKGKKDVMLINIALRKSISHSPRTPEGYSINVNM